MKLLGKYNSVREMYEKESPQELAKIFPHGKPVTRRDFLKAGAISFSAYLTAPAFLGLLTKPSIASAQACASALSMPAYVGLNLAGGFSIHGNVVGKNSSGALINDYSVLGGGTQAQTQAGMITQMGANFMGTSNILAGMLETAQPTTIANTSFMLLSCSSNDDNAQNPFDFTGEVGAMLSGDTIPTGLGSRVSPTGIGQAPSGRKPSSPVRIGSTTDLANSVSVTVGSLSTSQKADVLRMIADVSAMQTPLGASGGQVLSDLVNGANQKNVENVANGPAKFNPFQDPVIGNQIGAVWVNDGNQNLAANNTNSTEAVFASMVYASLKGYAGTCNLEMGGYDYHGQGRATQDQKDRSAGRKIGQIVETAARLGRPLFLCVTTDGSVGAPSGSGAGGAFTSDRGAGGGMFLIAFHPQYRPKIAKANGAPDYHIGALTNGQGADAAFPWGNNPSIAGKIAFANYVSFARNGDMSAFYAIAGSTLSQVDLDRGVLLRNERA